MSIDLNFMTRAQTLSAPTSLSALTGLRQVETASEFDPSQRKDQKSHAVPGMGVPQGDPAPLLKKFEPAQSVLQDALSLTARLKEHLADLKRPSSEDGAMKAAAGVEGVPAAKEPVREFMDLSRKAPPAVASSVVQVQQTVDALPSSRPTTQTLKDVVPPVLSGSPPIAQIRVDIETAQEPKDKTVEATSLSKPVEVLGSIGKADPALAQHRPVDGSVKAPETQSAVLLKPLSAEQMSVQSGPSRSEEFNAIPSVPSAPEAMFLSASPVQTRTDRIPVEPRAAVVESTQVKDQPPPVFAQALASHEPALDNAVPLEREANPADVQRQNVELPKTQTPPVVSPPPTPPTQDPSRPEAARAPDVRPIDPEIPAARVETPPVQVQARGQVLESKPVASPENRPIQANAVERDVPIVPLEIRGAPEKPNQNIPEPFGAQTRAPEKATMLEGEKRPILNAAVPEQARPAPPESAIPTRPVLPVETIRPESKEFKTLEHLTLPVAIPLTLKTTPPIPVGPASPPAQVAAERAPRVTPLTAPRGEEPLVTREPFGRRYPYGQSVLIMSDTQRVFRTFERTAAMDAGRELRMIPTAQEVQRIEGVEKQVGLMVTTAKIEGRSGLETVAGIRPTGDNTEKPLFSTDIRPVQAKPLDIAESIARPESKLVEAVGPATPPQVDQIETRSNPTERFMATAQRIRAVISPPFTLMDVVL